jgi:hypothetical protein
MSESPSNSSEKVTGNSSAKRKDVLKVGVESTKKRNNLKGGVNKELKPYIKNFLGSYAKSTEDFIKGIVSGADKEGGMYSIISSLANNLFLYEKEGEEVKNTAKNKTNQESLPIKLPSNNNLSENLKTQESEKITNLKVESPKNNKYNNLKEGSKKLLENPKSIQEVAKFLGVSVSASKVFNLIVLNETGYSNIFNNNRFIRTNVTPKDNQGRTSTAYGPAQITKTLANKYLTEKSHLFNSLELDYLTKFVAQGNNMIKVKSKGGIYGYGGKGETYFRTKKSKILYYQIALKMFDDHISNNRGNFLEAAKDWRGDDLDEEYFKPIKKYQKENGNLKIYKKKNQTKPESSVKESNENLPVLNKKILSFARNMITKGDKGDGKFSPIKRLKSEGSGDYQKGKIKTSCWDWATEVYARAGAKKKGVYSSKVNGKGEAFRNHVRNIKPGDYLIVHNGNRYLDGTHSIIFAGWENGKVGKKAISYSYSGGKKPPKKFTYDVSKGQIRGIFKPIPR